MDTVIVRHGDGFASGAAPTLADCHLVPQVYPAERFGLDPTPCPSLAAAAAAHPGRQTDAG